MGKSKHLVGIMALGVSAIALAACNIEVEETEDVGAVQQDAKEKIFCGGFAGIACPADMRCVDDPHDDCDPDKGGADCGGICRPGGGPKTCNVHSNNDDKQYVAEGDTCAVIRFFCAPGMEAFFDDCGCGCQPLPGEECNGVVCGEGESCCNYSCSICVPEGGFCTQQFCESI